ncbi:uncharacterized protein LOC125494834 [Beta vulgaris subsp. vulgaris]|uniref:uncharacterized protein LOC125494834 n=1 Tax=Beta vulgaris subsp. vulgaris TaxID=3555 RepID=UPI002036924A|nr:uncharacterized protein LOC125494834 [Beta vulgaris subsp. vulgaris]
MVVSHNDRSSPDNHPHHRLQNGGKHKNKQGKIKNSGGGGWNNYGGGGGRNNSGSRGQTSGHSGPARPGVQTAPLTWGPWAYPPWAFPPCPYPNQGWARPSWAPRHQQVQQGAGLLGSGPRQQQQAYAADAPSVPTDIEAAMHTLGLTPPDPNWYMDTGATSHMTSSHGTLNSYFNLSISNGMIVGNGHSISIRGYGDAHLPSSNPPLTLKNVLHAPKIIKI